MDPRNPNPQIYSGLRLCQNCNNGFSALTALAIAVDMSDHRLGFYEWRVN